MKKLISEYLERQHEYDYIVADMSFIALIDVLMMLCIWGVQGKQKYTTYQTQFEVGIILKKGL